MNSIKGMVKSTLDIKKSTFLGFVFPVESDRDIERILEELKRTHSGANHYCYAYIVGENADHQKYHDDGEPSQTAGFPMMQVLQKQNLTNVLAVVIRFFGGVKLGASGLVRAYTKAISTALKEATVVSPVTLVYVDVTVSFAFSGSVENYLRNTVTVDNVSYTTHVTFYVSLKKSTLDTFQREIKDLTHAQARVDITSEVLVYQ